MATQRSDDRGLSHLRLAWSELSDSGVVHGGDSDEFGACRIRTGFFRKHLQQPEESKERAPDRLRLRRTRPIHCRADHGACGRFASVDALGFQTGPIDFKIDTITQADRSAPVGEAQSEHSGDPG